MALTPNDRERADARDAPLGDGLREDLAYPADLAAHVLDHWQRTSSTGRLVLPPPDISDLTALLSVCYHATLLREEGRAVTFRLALSHPSTFDAAAGPPSGLHRLVFDRPLQLDQHELRRLAPAAAFSRSLLGCFADSREIWGIVHSGPQWLQAARGGRATEQYIPQVPIIAATGPGRLVVSVGAVVLGELRDGRLAGAEMDVFRSQWMEARLGATDPVLWTALGAGDRPSDVGDAADSSFGALLAGHVLRRILATVRASQHGGTLILLPPSKAAELLSTDGCLQVKYSFRDEEPRRRILTLRSTIARALASLNDTRSAAGGWRAYEESRARDIVEMDEALFEVAHLVADLARVDGAVLLTDSLELLGFGVEIGGNLPEVRRVARAGDLEATRKTWVRTDRVGTRHRSAYRLCHAVPEALTLVVSQDGGLRFIRRDGDGVTYWEQVATGPWEG